MIRTRLVGWTESGPLWSPIDREYGPFVDEPTSSDDPQRATIKAHPTPHHPPSPLRPKEPGRRKRPTHSNIPLAPTMVDEWVFGFQCSLEPFEFVFRFPGSFALT